MTVRQTNPLPALEEEDLFPLILLSEILWQSMLLLIAIQSTNLNGKSYSTVSLHK